MAFLRYFSAILRAILLATMFHVYIFYCSCSKLHADLKSRKNDSTHLGTLKTHRIFADRDESGADKSARKKDEKERISEVDIKANGMKELLNRRVTVRMTGKEYETFKLQMELSGYRSMSIYLRDILFLTRIRRRNFSKTDSNMVRQMMMLRAELRKIGVNYNQRVKVLNTLSKRTDKKGRPIINMRDIDRDNLEMKAMMEKMSQVVMEMSEIVSMSQNIAVEK